MSNDEEKRLWIQNESGHVGVFNVRKLVLDYQPEGYDEKTPLGPRYIEVVPVTEHERVVAELKASIEHSETKVGWLLHDNEKNVMELKAELVQYHRMAASGVWIPSDEYREKIETIARQAREAEVSKAVIVIAKRVLYNAGLRPPDGGTPTVETICEDLNDAIKKIAAIENLK